MFIALYVYNGEFQMFPYDKEEDAIKSIEKHFDLLIKEDNFNPVYDEAFVLKNVGPGKEMELVYSSKEQEKYQS